MRVLDPPMRARAAVALCDRSGDADSSCLLAATTFVMAWAGRHFYVRAWKGAAPSHRRHEHADRDRHRRGLPLFGRRHRRARTCSRPNGARPDVYYEAVIIIIALVLLGNAMEARAKTQHHARAAAAGDSCSRRPRGCAATAARSTSRSPTCARGDLVIVRPGERIPGGRRHQSSGRGAVDESMLTGESMPVEKAARRSRDRRDHQHRRARSRSRPPASAPRACWRASSR